MNVRMRVGALLVLVLAGCGSAIGPNNEPSKWFVCKYVGTPGVDERLQTGDNPISVDESSIPISPVHPGSEFADAQGRSVVLEADTGQPEPSADDCPAPQGPPSSTTTTTTTTVKATTTTALHHDTTTTGAPTSTSTTSTIPTTTTAATTTTTSTTLPGTTSSSSTSSPTTSPTTTTLPGKTITFAFLGPVCVGDHPFIGWNITGQNLTPADRTATITITDVNGNIVKQLTDQPLQGQTLWPGATIDPDDWPGWIKVGDVWVEDPTDAIVRQGVFVTAEVNPSATGFVSYPPATAACASPKNPSRPAAPPATTTTAPGLPHAK